MQCFPTAQDGSLHLLEFLLSCHFCDSLLEANRFPANKGFLHDSQPFTFPRHLMHPYTPHCGFQAELCFCVTLALPTVALGLAVATADALGLFIVFPFFFASNLSYACCSNSSKDTAFSPSLEGSGCMGSFWRSKSSLLEPLTLPSHKANGGAGLVCCFGASSCLLALVVDTWYLAMKPWSADIKASPWSETEGAASKLLL